MLEWLIPDNRTTLERWIERVQGAIEQAAGTVERTTGRAAEVAGSVRRLAGVRLEGTRKRARASAGAGREALSERLDAVAQRTREIREKRARDRIGRAERRRARHARPLRLDVSGDDRIILRGRSPLDVRTSDGEVIRYRYYERPSLALRLHLHLTGRRLWPR